MRWEDVSYHNKSIKIVQNIQKSSIRKILQAYKAETQTFTGTTDKKLSRELGLYLLPPDGFGTDPRRLKKPGKPEKKGIPGGSGRSTQFKVEKLRYTSEGMNVTLTLTAKNQIRKPVIVAAAVSSETGDIPVKTWEEEMYTAFPFNISDLELTIEDLSSKRKGKPIPITGNFKNLGDVTVGLLKTGDRVCYGFKVDATGKKNIRLIFTMDVKIADRSLMISFGSKE